MVAKAAQYLNWLRWVMGGIWAVLICCATIPVGHATSNLQSWANLFGFSRLGKNLAGSGADNIVLFLAIISIAKYLNRLKKPLEDAFQVVKRALRDEHDR